MDKVFVLMSGVGFGLVQSDGFDMIVCIGCGSRMNFEELDLG